MKLRRTLTGDIIGSYLESADDVGLDFLEAHYLAGGDNKNLVSILNHARGDGFTIAPYRAAALDLAGKRIADINFVEEQVQQDGEEAGATPGNQNGSHGSGSA